MLSPSRVNVRDLPRLVLSFLGCSLSLSSFFFPQFLTKSPFFALFTHADAYQIANKIAKKTALTVGASFKMPVLGIDVSPSASHVWETVTEVQDTSTWTDSTTGTTTTATAKTETTTTLSRLASDSVIPNSYSKHCCDSRNILIQHLLCHAVPPTPSIQARKFTSQLSQHKSNSNCHGPGSTSTP